MRLFLIIILIFITCYKDANALSCGRLNAEENYNRYKYIFTGKVDEVVDGKVTFSSVEALKGKLPSQLTTIYACAKQNSNSCEWNTKFKKGKEYIVYAQENNDGNVEISKQLCLPISEKEGARYDINSFLIAKNNNNVFPLPLCSKNDFYTLIEQAENVFLGKIEKLDEYPEFLDIGGTAFYAKQKVKILKVWKGNFKKDSYIDLLSGGKFENFPYPEIRRAVDDPNMWAQNGEDEGIFLTKQMASKDGNIYEVVFDCNGFTNRPHFTPFNQTSGRNTNYFDQVEIYFGHKVPECKKATSMERTLIYENDIELSQCLINSAIQISASKSWYSKQLMIVLGYNSPKNIDTSLLTEILLKNGADPNYTRENLPALFLAIGSSTNNFNKKIGAENIELLLKYGADPDKKMGDKSAIEHLQDSLSHLKEMNGDKIVMHPYSESIPVYKARNMNVGKEIMELLKKYSNKKRK
jgi:hypothetical protein